MPDQATSTPEGLSATENPEIGLTVDADGIRTNYHDHGRGAPVVLLHGSGPGVSAWANWRMNIPVLAERFRAIAPDMLGFGYSDLPVGIDYTLEKWREHLRAFLDALELDRVSLIGNSFGGGLALAFAVTYPERVDKLVLMGSSGLSFELPPALDEIWGYEPSVENMRRLLDIMAYDRGLVTDDIAQMRYEASIRPGAQEAFSSMFPAPRQQGIEELATPEEQLRQLPHETLVIHGRADRVVPMEVGLRLFDVLEHSELHVFGECGHWTQIEKGGRFNDLVTGFLAS